MRRRLTIALLFLLLLACATVAWARVGGGESYSGGSSGSSGSSGSGGGGDGGGEALFLLLRLLFWMNIEHPLIGIPVDILLVIIWIRVKRGGIGSGSLLLVRASTADLPGSTASTGQSVPFDVLRRFDPNFSEVVFSDFCYALYGRVHNARGANDLDRYAPYVGEAARRSLIARNPPGLTEVRGIVLGSFNIVNVRLDGKTVLVTVDYESNMTEISTGEASWYLRERWVFERERDILSAPPEKAKAEHCPRCGAALKTRTDGSCEYCGVKITSGAFQWFVRNITVTAKESRGPRLTSNVPEQGTSLPTKLQPKFREQFAQFQSAHPEFLWEDLERRARETAKTLQDAWTARDWERVRPLESDTLFQTHRYWMDAYTRQGLRNVVDAFSLGRVEPVRIVSDPFYDAITMRLWASGRDYTTNPKGKVVAGSNNVLRSWSEYWTFIRTRATQADPSKTVSCPNCGAAVEVGTSGICRFCGGKLTSGEFGWVLSRIEQDEAYRG
ncbi:MAG: TIM44-like domain-containing protein [Thermoanaerobaculia bacterium]